MIDIAARYILSPILWWQARRIRSAALRLPDAAGPRHGQDGQGPDLRLLIIGDSSAAGVGTSHQDEALAGQMLKRLSQTNRVRWSVNAKTGSTTLETLDRLQTAPAEKVDIVSVSLGVNDITTRIPLNQWINQYRELLDLIDHKYEPGVISVSGIPQMKYFPLLPQPLRWIVGAQATRFDRALQNIVTRRPNCRFVTMDFEPDTSLMSEDGFHPGPKIYADWGRKVYCAIRQDVRRLSVAYQGDETFSSRPH